MKSAIKHIVFAVLLLIGKVGYSQNYPIQTFVNIAPPYSSYLLDYADPFDNRMMITMTNTDFAAPSVLIKVRMTIEGPGYSMVTDDLLMPTYTLSPGVPLEITGADLSPYLNSQNLIFNGGLTKEVYEQSQVLPEGPGTICVEVIDWQSGNQAVISNPACGFTNFALYQPPLIATPYCGKVYSQNEITTPPQIMFSWTPLHMSSPNSGGTMYHFELFQVMDANLDPNMVVYGPVLYEEHTPNTFVNFSLQQPLIVGNDYVWRVQAYEVNGRDLFVNNGYSQVCTFKYGDAAENALAGETLTLESNGTGTRQGFAWWNASNLFNHYVLEVRKTGNPDYAWFPYETDNGDYKVNSLEPNTEYECRVKGVLGSAETDWSNTSVFTTLPKVTYGCGSNDLPGKNPNIIPAEFLKPGDIVQCGQFEMHVTAADPGSQPGRFTGYGRVTIPFMFMNMNVEFTDVLIDEDLNLRDGKVEAITEGVDAWLEDQFTIFIPGSVDEVQVNPQDSVFVFYLGNGDTLHIDWPTDGPVTYQDDDGKVITLNPDGTFTITGLLNIDNDPLFATKDHQIIFKASNQQQYGFDAYPGIIEWQSHYPAIELSDSTLYFVPWKSVGSNHTDIVLAVVRGDNVGTPSFEDGNGMSLASTQINDSTYEVTVGNIVNAGIKVYAKDSDGLRIGKLNVLNYASKNLDVVVIPVGNAVPPNETALQDKLNDIFGQAYTFFGVTVDTVFDYQGDLGVNGVDAPVTTLMNKYSQEMKDIRDGYFSNRSTENKLYLFVVEDLEGDLDGYMVRGKSVGFIEDQKDLETYAHEIGHGAFGLEHTFPKVDKGQTNNLMDYHGPGVTDKSHLTAQQWKEIHEWSIIWSIFDDEEDGGYVVVRDMTELKDYRNDDSTYTFLSKSGKPITIPKNTEFVVFNSFNDFWSSETPILQFGTLSRFKYDDTVYVGTKTGGNFNGYRALFNNEGNQTVGKTYTDKYTYKHNVKHVIAGLPCVENGDNFTFHIYLADANQFAENQPGFSDSTTYTSSGELISEAEIINAFKYAQETDKFLVAAKVTDSLTNELMTILNYMGPLNCGLDFIYCMKSSQEFIENPDLYACSENIINSTDKTFREFIDQNEVEFYLGEADWIYPEEWYQEQTEIKAFYLYDMISFYKELIEGKLKDQIDCTTLSDDESFKENVGKVLEWIYESNQGGDLDQFQSDCIMSQLDIDYRIQILKIAGQTSYFDFAASKNQLISDLIRTISSEDDFKKLMNFLNQPYEDGIWFWNLYGDLSGSSLSSFVLSLTLKMLEYGYYQGDESHLVATWSESYPNGYGFVDYALPVTKSGTKSVHYQGSYRYIKFENDFSYSGATVRLEYNETTNSDKEQELLDYGYMRYSSYKEDSLWEFVKINIEEDFQFQHPYLDRQLRKYDQLRVPMFFAYWIMDKQSFTEDMLILRKVIALAASIISVATMNPGPMLALELSWNAAELLVANVEDAILSSDDENAKAFIDFYNYASMAAGGYFLLRGVKNVGVNLGKKFFKTDKVKLQNRVNQYKTDNGLNKSGFLDEIEPLARFYKFLKNNQAYVTNFGPQQLKNVRQAYYEAFANSFCLKDPNIRLIVKDATDVPGGADGLFLKLTNGTEVRIGVMKYSDEFDTPYPLFESNQFLSREINNTDEILGELDGVIYRLNSSSNVRANGEIKILKTASGEIKFKVVGVGVDFNTFLSKFQITYPKIYTWLSGNQVPFGILQKLDDWVENNQTLLLKLESEFSDPLGAVFIEQPNLVNTWQRIYEVNPESFFKSDPLRVEKFSKFNVKNQDEILKFTDLDELSTCSKFLDDCDEQFINFLNQNQEFLEGFTLHKNNSLPANEMKSKYDLIGEEIRDTRVPEELKGRLESWLDRSSSLSNFGNYTQKGRDLGNNIWNSIKLRTGQLFDDIAAHLEINSSSLSQYEIYKEVPLLTEGGFMKADIVLVKRDGFGLIEDVIIIENKLSSGTGFTVRQKEGWKKLANGESLNVKSRTNGIDQFGNPVTLGIGTSFSSSKTTSIKINDHGEISVSNVEISNIPVNNWKNYTYTPTGGGN